MDYEKKYNEALKRAKDILFGSTDTSQSVTKEMIEDIFPELAESEDEKIRKELIEHIKANREADFVLFQKFSEEEIISWLEKQGASIDVDSILNKVDIKSAYKDGNAWCILYGDNIQDGTCGFGDTKEDALVAFIKELLEKQGEFYTKKDVDDAYLEGMVCAKNELEKQGEQKPDVYEYELERIVDKLNEVIGKLGDIHEVLSKPFQFPYRDYTPPQEPWYKTHGVEKVTPVTCETLSTMLNVPHVSGTKGKKSPLNSEEEDNGE